jgi:hypothetical protein
MRALGGRKNSLLGMDQFAGGKDGPKVDFPKELTRFALSNPKIIIGDKSPN